MHRHSVHDARPRRRSDSCQISGIARRGSRPRSANGTAGSLDARLRSRTIRAGASVRPAEVGIVLRENLACARQGFALGSCRRWERHRTPPPELRGLRRASHCARARCCGCVVVARIPSPPTARVMARGLRHGVENARGQCPPLRPPSQPPHGDKVAVRWHVTANHTGPGAGLEANPATLTEHRQTAALYSSTTSWVRVR